MFSATPPTLRAAPEWVGLAHGLDQPANFERDLRPVAAGTVISPKQAKTRAMPLYDDLGLNDRQGVPHAWGKSIEGGKDQTIDLTNRVGTEATMP
jgi:hypothetical protein